MIVRGADRVETQTLKRTFVLVEHTSGARPQGMSVDKGCPSDAVIIVLQEAGAASYAFKPQCKK